MISWGGTTATAPNPRVIAPATTALFREFVVALTALADVSYGWFAYHGYVDALVDGGTTDVTAGHFVKLANASTAVVEDGANYAATSIALCMPGQTAATTSTRVYMLGYRATI
jgi:hypothetical protein